MRPTASGSIAVLAVCGLLANLFFTSKLIYREVTFIGKHLQLSQEEKMRIKVGGWVIDFTTFVKNHSPENSVIMIPPSTDPWSITGHREMMSYYLYPRRVVNGPTDHSGAGIREYLGSHPEITHMIVTSEGALWPSMPRLLGEDVQLLGPGWGIARLGK